jgi:hypothetical protein
MHPTNQSINPYQYRMMLLEQKYLSCSWIPILMCCIRLSVRQDLRIILVLYRTKLRLQAIQPIRGNYPTALARHLLHRSLMAKELFDWSSDGLSQETPTTLVALDSLGRPAIGCHHRYPASSLFSNCSRHTQSGCLAYLFIPP